MLRQVFGTDSFEDYAWLIDNRGLEGSIMVSEVCIRLMSRSKGVRDVVKISVLEDGVWNRYSNGVSDDGDDGTIKFRFLNL